MYVAFTTTVGHTAYTPSFIDGADKGIIPLTCQELFDRVESKKEADPNLSFTVEVSYIEVNILLASIRRQQDD